MRKKVSGKTHTKQQMDNYANQNNPNNKAFRAREENKQKLKKNKNPKCDLGILTGESFGWCDD